MPEWFDFTSFKPFASVKKLKCLKLVEPRVNLFDLADAIFAGCRETLETLIIDRGSITVDSCIVSKLDKNTPLKKQVILKNSVRQSHITFNP